MVLTSAPFQVPPVPENTEPIPTNLSGTQHGIGCGLCGQYMALGASEHSEAFSVFHVRLTRVLSTLHDDKALFKQLSASLKSLPLSLCCLAVPTQ